MDNISVGNRSVSIEVIKLTQLGQVIPADGEILGQIFNVAFCHVGAMKAKLQQEIGNINEILYSLRIHDSRCFYRLFTLVDIPAVLYDAEHLLAINCVEIRALCGGHVLFIYLHEPAGRRTFYEMS